MSVLCVIVFKIILLPYRTFKELSRAEDQFSLCRELCEDLAEDLKKEGLKVLNSSVSVLAQNVTKKQTKVR